MNEAAKTHIIREARRAVERDRRDHRANYRRAIVNPVTVDEHMQQFAGCPHSAWEQLAQAEPDLAALDGACELFETVYRRTV